MSERVTGSIPPPIGPGEDPLTYYTILFVRFLQVVFQTFPKGQYHWDLDPLNTEIMITDQATIASEVVEKRPAIILSRGPIGFGNLSLDQFSSFDSATDRRSHTDLLSSTMNYSCISKEGLEAQRLAWIAAMATRRLKRSLMRAGLHRVGEEMNISSESPPGAFVSHESDGEIVVVQVSVPFYFQDFWSIEPIDKNLLKGIDFNLSSQLDPQSTPIRGPSMNGQLLNVIKTVPLTSGVRVTAAPTPKPRQ